MAQVVGSPPSKNKALSSNNSITKTALTGNLKVFKRNFKQT
jgi:hypothetical protein